MNIFPLHCADFYKTGHIKQYPEGTEYVYSNFTARSDKYSDNPNGKVVFFGLQGLIKWLLIDLWDREFFDKRLSDVVYKYKRRMDKALGDGSVDWIHIEELHELGYLPISIKALPEGSVVDIKVPLFTIINTDPKFYWLVNYLETMISSEIWKMITSATTAYKYKQILLSYAEVTGCSKEFVQFQAHDFSMRGMSGIHDAAQSGAAHLLSFNGTDTICAIDYLEDYYDASETFVGGSVPATEHSVMSMGGKEGEKETFRRLIQDVYPSGIVSIVSDTWDFWKVIKEYAKDLKDIIEARDGKVVFRPDSGNPADIICGKMGCHGSIKGAVEYLWDIFGGTVNEKGFKVLSEKVGLIYGDSITLSLAEEILRRLKEKGFCSSNIVFGIGSYTYQHVTRDTYDCAIKATWGVVNGEDREISKDPITDDGTKKSAVGLLNVIKRQDGKYVCLDRQENDCNEFQELKEVFRDGELLINQSLEEVRVRLNEESK